MNPKRLELKKSKLDWNLLVTDFIKRLIAIKRGFNGKGTPALGIPDSILSHPLPLELTSQLHELSQEYQQLASQAESVSVQQADYASSLSNKQASWFGSRTWAKAKWLPQLEEEERSARSRILDEVLDLISQLEKIRKLLLTGKLENFTKTVTLVTLLGKQWLIPFTRSIAKLEELQSKVKTESLPSKNEFPEISNLSKIEEILNSLDSIGKIVKYLLTKPKSETDSEKIKSLFRELFELTAVWNQITQSKTPNALKLDELSFDILKTNEELFDLFSKHLGSGGLLEWLKLIPKNESLSSESNLKIFLQKSAKKGITDWLKEKWVGINPSLLQRYSLDLLQPLNSLDDKLENALDKLESTIYSKEFLSTLWYQTGNLILKILSETMTLGQVTQLMMRRSPQTKVDSRLIEMDFRELRMIMNQVANKLQSAEEIISS